MCVDVKKISTHGSSFYKAAHRCAEQVQNSDGTFERLLIPENVCLAFSVELNLKALIYSEGHAPNDTHNLRTLFRSLNGKTQNAIEAIIGYEKNLFDGKLKEIADSFEFWRYVYEQGDFSFDLEVLNKLAMSCEEISNNIINRS